MKKSVVFVALIVLFVAKLKAQPYQSLFGRNSTAWAVMVDADAGPLATIAEDFSIAYQKDTIAFNAPYKKVIVTTTNSISYSRHFRNFLIREDTITGLAWYREYDNTGCNAIDTAEYLFLNLNLAVGDTFNIDGAERNFLPSDKVVDSVYYDNQNKKHIRFVGIQLTMPPVQVEFIEGLGSTMTIFYKHQLCELAHPNMLCVWKDGVKVFSHPYFNGICDPLNSQNVIASEQKNTNVSLYPNPVTDWLTIKWSNNSNKIFYKILDILGREVMSGHLTSEEKINIHSLSAGVYGLILESGANEFFQSFSKL